MDRRVSQSISTKPLEEEEDDSDDDGDAKEGRIPTLGAALTWSLFAFL